MKIEIGESLISSWLRHVKQCRIVQTNWKVSSTWNNGAIQNDNTKVLLDKIKQYPELSDVFKTEPEQTFKQAELDVIGLDDNNDTVYLVESAYHENGLHYGATEVTSSRICKKLLRAYLIGTEFFPDKRYNIIFASPKVHPADIKMISSYLEILNNHFGTEQCRFYFYINDGFKNEILLPTLKASQNESDTAELFLRSCKLLNMFGLIRLPETNVPVSTPAKKPVSVSVSTNKTAPVAAAAQKTDTIQQRYVTIKGTRVETHPRPGESLQHFVKRTFSQLIEKHLLDDALFQKLFDRDFCRKTFGISYALLQTDWSNCFDNADRARYWRDFRIAGTYFCCSQWWRQNFPHYEEKLAAWLESLADK